MRCPKCQYISFDAVDRCRNCGYDFSLALELTRDPDLPLTRDEPAALNDLALGGAEADAVQSGRRQEVTPDLHSLDRALEATGKELPLFSRDAPPDVTPTEIPPARPPLSVRRSTPDPGRPWTSAPPWSELPPDLPEIEPAEPAADPGAVDAPDGIDPELFEMVAFPKLRLVSAIIDLAFMAAVDLATLYFTLALVGLAFADLAIVPPIPLAGFFLLLNGGYLSLLTAAGGQTLGKMATGIMVVRSDGEPVTLQMAAVRGFASILSAVPLGLGFVPILFGPDRRAVHDRVAGTIVIDLAATNG